MTKKIILGAAAACAALVSLTATAASADPWWRTADAATATMVVGSTSASIPPTA